MLGLVQSTQTFERAHADTAQTLLADAIQCGSPKGLRIHLQQYDTLMQERYGDHLVACSAGLASAAMAMGYAPALVRATEHCLDVVSVEATAGCMTEAPHAAAALLGLGGLSLAGYALYLGQNMSARYVTRMDRELEDRFTKTLDEGEAATRVQYLMTRYSRLSDAQRELVKDGLFNAYLDNKGSAGAA